MSETSKNRNRPLAVIKYAVILAAGWTLVAGVSLLWNYSSHKAGARNTASVAARAQLANDILFRRWNAGQGGVYVPITDSCQPNPYLTEVAERDIETPSGRRLTLINPEYMTRQVHELSLKVEGARGHITSLNPIRPENAADAWEKRALESFEQGEREFASVEQSDGEAYLRLMQPLVTEKGCLQCHAKQGYKEGDVRGGISVSLPMAPYEASGNKEIAAIGIGHGVLWLLGLATIALGAVHLRRRERKRKLAVEALRESELKFRTVANYPWDWEGWIDPDGQLRYISPSCERITGYRSDEFMGDSALLVEIVHPDHQSIMRGHLSDISPQGHCLLNFRIITRSGETRWISHGCQPIIDDDGQFLGRRFSNRDITDQMLAEKALKESEASHADAQRIAHLGHWDLDLTTNRLDWSAEVFRIFDRAPQEFDVSVEAFMDAVHPEDRALVRQAYTESVQSRTPYDVTHRLLMKDGSVKYVNERCETLYDEAGTPIRSIGTVLDITDRMLAEAALRESETRYRNLYRETPVMLHSIDRQGRIVSVSNMWLDKMGYQLSEVIGRKSTEFLTEDSARYARDVILPEFFRTGICSNVPYQFVKKNGKIMDVLLSATSERNDDGSVAQSMAAIEDITERKQAEDALSESENKYRTLFEQSADAILIIEGGRFVDCNLATVKMLGYKNKKELLETHPSQLSPETQPDGKSSFDKANEMMSIAFDQGSHRFEWDHMRHNGEVFPVEVLLTAVPFRERTFLHVVWRDITERKRAEEKIQQLSAHTEALLASVPDIIMEVDSNKVYTWANRTGYEFFGDDVIGKAAEYYFEGEQTTYDAVEPLLADNEDIVVYVESWQRRRDGENRLLAWWCKVRKDSEGRVIGALSTARDITEQRQAEEALRLSEGRYHQLFNSVMEGIVTVDENDVIQFCNPAFADIFEVDSRADLNGRCLLDFLPEDQRPVVFAQTESRKKGLSSQYELEVLTAKGHRKTLLAAISPRFDNKNRYRGAFGAMIDITETKRLQKLESRAQRLETAGQVAGQVAHDFNNMLAPMMAYPELIRERLPEGDPGIKYLEAIEESAQKIADLNQQLLTLSRRGHYNQEVLSLNAIVHQVLRDMAPPPHTLVIETALSADLMNIKGGLAQMHRIVMNLVVNARDAVRDIGKISIKTENYYADDTKISYGCVPLGEYAKITISDTGCGIPNEAVQKIFDPFFTTKSTDKKRGSGLGLSVVASVVKDHDGYIDFTTRVGVGTSFYLYFPLTRESASEDPSSEIPRGSETILVVDDDEIQRDVSARLLTTLGYRVTTCGSGKMAVEMLTKRSFDLLVLDMIMPNDLDGTETYRQALQIRSDQRAIIVSGFSESDRVAEAQGCGAGAFVKKPFSRKVIALAVRHELDQQVEIPARA